MKLKKLFRTAFNWIFPSYFTVQDKDSLFRHVVFPLAFSNNRKHLKAVRCWKIHDDSASEVKLEASVAWDRFLPTTDLVHQYGCRLAEKQNRSLAPERKEKDPRIYCGAYAVVAEAIRQLESNSAIPEIEKVRVMHKMEEGEVAHTALLFDLRAEVSDKEAVKTAIADRLSNAALGPLKHRCTDDSINFAAHPSEQLAPAPNGEIEPINRALTSRERLRLYVGTYVCRELSD